MRRLAALLLALAVLPADAGDAAPQLARLRQALETLQYQGVFVYLHDGQVDAMQVTRTIGPNGAREHLAALTGDRRQVLREGRSVQFLLPAGLMTLTGGAGAGLDPARLERATAHYDIGVAGHSRVAGYEAAVVDARPRDAARYGYRLWIERETGMLLGSALLDEKGNAIEQLMFTSLELKPGAPTAPPAPAPPATAPAPGQWHATMPEGFRLVGRPAAERDAEHQLFSDGLANVSLYVEPLRPGSADWTGSSRRGALAVVGRVRGGYHVVVMGDLPLATVERIADSAQPRVPN